VGLFSSSQAMTIEVVRTAIDRASLLEMARDQFGDMIKASWTSGDA
jgi:hypothetical protein